MRVGIVGCGLIANVHAEIINKIPEIDLVGVMDILPERGMAFAEKFDTQPFSCFESLLAEIDVLHICTPHYLHAEMAKQAAEHQVAVFTEKPPAINREQFADLEAVAEKVSVGICFQNRYTDQVRYIKEYLVEHELGKLIGARGNVFWHRDSAYYQAGPWRGNWKEAGGGALMNQAVHTLDLLIYFLGVPTMVESSLDNLHLPEIEVEDILTIAMEIQNAPVFFSCTTANYTDTPIFVELAFEKVTIRLTHNQLFFEREGEIVEKTFETKATIGKAYWGNGHEGCIRDFYDALLTKRAVPVTVADVKETMTVVFTAYEKARKKAGLIN